jgi:hypothetical protein
VWADPLEVGVYGHQIGLELSLAPEPFHEIPAARGPEDSNEDGEAKADEETGLSVAHFPIMLPVHLHPFPRRMKCFHDFHFRLRKIGILRACGKIKP